MIKIGITLLVSELLAHEAQEEDTTRGCGAA